MKGSMFLGFYHGSTSLPLWIRAEQDSKPSSELSCAKWAQNYLLTKISTSQGINTYVEKKK